MELYKDFHTNFKLISGLSLQEKKDVVVRDFEEMPEFNNTLFT
jgi:hypothetical protein